MNNIKKPKIKIPYESNIKPTNKEIDRSKRTEELGIYKLDAEVKTSIEEELRRLEKIVIDKFIE